MGLLSLWSSNEDCYWQLYFNQTAITWRSRWCDSPGLSLGEIGELTGVTWLHLPQFTPTFSAPLTRPKDALSLRQWAATAELYIHQHKSQRNVSLYSRVAPLSKETWRSVVWYKGYVQRASKTHQRAGKVIQWLKFLPCKCEARHDSVSVIPVIPLSENPPKISQSSLPGIYSRQQKRPWLIQSERKGLWWFE